jgi:hypothetical protein
VLFSKLLFPNEIEIYAMAHAFDLHAKKDSCKKSILSHFKGGEGKHNGFVALNIKAF